MKRFQICFLIFIILSTINTVQVSSENIPLIIETNHNDNFCSTSDSDSFVNIYRFHNDQLIKKNIPLGQNSFFDTLVLNDNDFINFVVNSEKEFIQADETETSFEDVYWGCIKKYGENIHKLRKFPKLFRSLGEDSWNFSLDKTGTSEIKFDSTGRYVSGSSSGGISIVHDHIPKHEVVEKWGPPVGGLYRIGFGYWFHNAEDMDTRKTYETGNLYMRQMALRKNTIFLKKNKNEQESHFEDFYDYRMITFKTGSDGIPRFNLKSLETGNLNKENILINLSQDNKINYLKFNRNRKISFFENNVLHKDIYTVLDKFNIIIPSGKKSDIYNGKKMISTINRNGKHDYNYVLNNKISSVKNSWFGNGGTIFSYDSKEKIISYFSRNEMTGKRSPERKITFDSEIKDFAADCHGDLYILFINRSNHEIIDRELMNILKNRKYESKDQIINISSESKKKLKKKNISMNLKYSVRIPMVLSKLKPSQYNRLSLIKNEDLMKNKICSIYVGKEDYTRLIDKKDNVFSFKIPGQLQGQGYLSDLNYRLVIKNRILPPENRGIDYIADITHIDPLQNVFSENEEISFYMENYPQFDTDGINMMNFPKDENSNGISGGLSNNVIRDSMIFSWKLEKLDQNNSVKNISEINSVYNSFNSDFLRSYNSSIKNIVRKKYPFIETLKGLAKGHYRISLKIYFNYYDFSKCSEMSIPDELENYILSSDHIHLHSEYKTKLENHQEFIIR